MEGPLQMSDSLILKLRLIWKTIFRRCFPQWLRNPGRHRTNILFGKIYYTYIEVYFIKYIRICYRANHYATTPHTHESSRHCNQSVVFDLIWKHWNIFELCLSLQLLHLCLWFEFGLLTTINRYAFTALTCEQFVQMTLVFILVCNF